MAPTHIRRPALRVNTMSASQTPRVLAKRLSSGTFRDQMATAIHNMNSGSLMSCAVIARRAGPVLAATVAKAASGFERLAVRTITRHNNPAAMAPKVKVSSACQWATAGQSDDRLQPTLNDSGKTGGNLVCHGLPGVCTAR